MTRVADASLYYPEYRYKAWGYGEWIAIEGLLSAAEICGNPRYLGFAEGLVSGWISKRDQLVPADHLAPGVALTRLYTLTGREEFLDRAIAVARLILNAPRSSRGARLPRPDADRRAWVDCIYSDPPLFTSLGLLTGDATWFSEAVAYTLELWEVLVDSELPLLYHGYDDETRSHLGLLWGRGVGWALLGMVDTLAELPATVTGREEILANMSHMADACGRCRLRMGTGAQFSTNARAISRTRLPHSPLSVSAKRNASGCSTHLIRKPPRRAGLS